MNNNIKIKHLFSTFLPCQIGHMYGSLHLSTNHFLRQYNVHASGKMIKIRTQTQNLPIFSSPQTLSPSKSRVKVNCAGPQKMAAHGHMTWPPFWSLHV